MEQHVEKKQECHQSYQNSANSKCQQLFFFFYHTKINKIYMHNMYHQLLHQNKLKWRKVATCFIILIASVLNPNCTFEVIESMKEARDKGLMQLLLVTKKENCLLLYYICTGARGSLVGKTTYQTISCRLWTRTSSKRVRKRTPLPPKGHYRHHKPTSDHSCNCTRAKHPKIGITHPLGSCTSTTNTLFGMGLHSMAGGSLSCSQAC